MRDVFIAVKLTECPVILKGVWGELLGANMQYFRFVYSQELFGDFVSRPRVMVFNILGAKPSSLEIYECRVLEIEYL